MEEGKPEWLGGTNCFNLKLRTGFGTFTFPLSAPPWLRGSGWGTAGKGKDAYRRSTGSLRFVLSN